MRKSINIIIILLVVFSNFVYSYAETKDSIEKKSTVGILPFPFVIYTPETGLAAGVSFMYFHNADSENEMMKPNVFQVSGFFTEKKQISSYLKLERYFKGNDKKLQIDLEFQDMPLYFWGVGPNTPSSNEELLSMLSYGAKVMYIMKTQEYLYFGPYYEFYNYDVERQVGSILYCNNILGNNGSTVSGLGLVANWDSRDKLFFPKRGTYWDTKLLFYSKAYGSDHNFMMIDMDYRRFFGLGGRNVLALQGVFNSRFGDVPFQKKAMIGGSNMMRGYYIGRYIDDQYIAAQAEFRYHIWWRLAGTVFGSMGQLAPSIDKYSTHNLKVAAGFGFRFLVNTDELLFLRADFAITEFGPQIYLEALEAF